MASIVVVGGGAAGLVCAWRLGRAGHDVEVLEFERELGGRLGAETALSEVGSFAVPRGASFFTSGQQNVMSVLTAVGLDGAVQCLEPTGPGRFAASRRLGRRGSVPGAIVRGGRIDACDLGPRFGLSLSRGLPPGAKLRVGRLAGELVRHRQRLDPLHPERAARLETGEEVLDYVARTVGDTARDRLVGPALETVLGCELRDVSRTFMLLSLASLRRGAAPLALEGGFPAMIARLAEKVVVRGGCEVFAVHTETGGAQVQYRAGGRESSVVADAVVMATPAPLVPILCAKLTPDERGFFESVRYAPAMTVHLMLASAPERAVPFAIGFARGDSSGLRSVLQNHRLPGAAPERAGLLSAALAEPAVMRLANASDEQIARFAVGALSGTVLGPVSPVDTRVHRLHDARPIFPRGALSRLENFGVRIDRSPRIAFAGDYMIAPTVEGALTSGMQAAWRIVQALEAAPMPTRIAVSRP